VVIAILRSALECIHLANLRLCKTRRKFSVEKKIPIAFEIE
jgi:hypothetical protein